MATRHSARWKKRHRPGPSASARPRSPGRALAWSRCRAPGAPYTTGVFLGSPLLPPPLPLQPGVVAQVGMVGFVLTDNPAEGLSGFSSSGGMQPLGRESIPFLAILSAPGFQLPSVPGARHLRRRGTLTGSRREGKRKKRRGKFPPSSLTAYGAHNDGKGEPAPARQMDSREPLLNTHSPSPTNVSRTAEEGRGSWSSMATERGTSSRPAMYPRLWSPFWMSPQGPGLILLDYGMPAGLIPRS